MNFFLKWFLLLFVFNCENPIDINASNDLNNTDECLINDNDLTCDLNENCQWINNQCVSIDSHLCIMNYGGIIDDCGLCSSGITNLIPNQDKNICGECFAEEFNDQNLVVKYDHDNDKSTEELFCSCPDSPTSILNDGCCGIIANNNYFKDSNGNTCDPNISSNCNNTATRDACGVCGGDNSTCKDCDGVINGDAILDECGVCDGDGIADGACDCFGNILDVCGVCNGDGIPQGYCDCNGNTLDCNGECGGIAIFDCFGICGGDAILDCEGNCGGNNLIPEGTCDCDGNIIPEGDCDCDGNILDCEGICGGTAIEDCLGICNGTAVIDECGVCNGDGILAGACDCDGNVLDECQVCGGSGYNDSGCCGNDTRDCQLVCGGNAQVDDCGICNGQNLSKDMCNVCFGDNSECLQGILTLKDWYFDFKSIWPNSECSGPINYNYYNYICTNEVCYDYSIRFNEDFTFDFTIQSWDESSDCDWLFDSQDCLNIATTFLSGVWSLNITQVSPLLLNGNILCLDYEPDDLEDFCFDDISLLNNYESCINDPSSCDNNILYLSLSNNNQCYQEHYSTEGYIHSNNLNNNIDINELSIINQNILKAVELRKNNE